MKRISIVLLLLVGFTTISYGQKKRVKPGYYIDHSMNRIEGMFVYHKAITRGNGITPSFIKLYKDGKKVGKYTAEDINGFVLEEDTFTAITISERLLGKERESKEFGKRFQEGKMDFYYIPLIRIVTNPTTKISKRYVGVIPVVSMPGTDLYLSFSFPKKAKKAFVELISDYPELAKEAEEEKALAFYGKVEDFVIRYNKWALENE